ncbi:hypothetical protein [Falsiroseomonas ponticola]|uniref:hypothetical protein n=1 Tax=Falsiroseomonas ponticola TaxID=2786951 RepID=UPI0019328A2C|nr:hypothetical protein [Roseomonas ponticola]
MPEAPLPPGALPLLAACAGGRVVAGRPAWLSPATFALMRQAAASAGPAGDGVSLAREVVAARHPALPAALLTEAAQLAAAGAGAAAGAAAGKDLP